jgi:hypothetical protein
MDVGQVAGQLHGEEVEIGGSAAAKGRAR